MSTASKISPIIYDSNLIKASQNEKQKLKFKNYNK